MKLICYILTVGILLVLSSCGKHADIGEKSTLAEEKAPQEDKVNNSLLNEYWTDLVRYHTEISLNLLYMEEIKSEISNNRKAELEKKISYDYHDNIIEMHSKVEPLFGVYTAGLEKDFIESVKEVRDGLEYDQWYVDWVELYYTKVFEQYRYNIGSAMIEEFMKNTDINYTLVGLDYIKHNKQRMIVEDRILTNVDQWGLVIELHTDMGKIYNFCVDDIALELIHNGSYYVVARYKDDKVSLLSKFEDFSLIDSSEDVTNINFEWNYSDFAPAPFTVQEFWEAVDQGPEEDWYDNGIFSAYMSITYPTDKWEYVGNVYIDPESNSFGYLGFQIYVQQCESAQQVYRYLVPITLATAPEVYAYDANSNDMKRIFCDGVVLE